VARTQQQRQQPPRRNPQQGQRRPNNTQNNQARRNGNNRRSPPNARTLALQNQKKLNQKLVACPSAVEVLQTLQEAPGALTKTASGGVLNTVNFSTAIHRLARHSLQPQARAPTLADARLALLVAGLAEALVADTTLPQNKSLRFTTRELSNIGWALAKLRIAPPLQAMALSSRQEHPDQITTTAKQLRIQIMEISQEPRAPGQALKPVWIPLLSQLAGYILDEIANQMEDVGANFQQQEMSNLLWAWATAGRANPVVFGSVVRRMMAQETTDRNPQEWSNSVWAFATAQVYDGHAEMLHFLAQQFTDDPNFVTKFKPQEISNTLWGVATLLSNMEQEVSAPVAASVLTIVRAAVPYISANIQDFKTQELSNSLWGLATLGFGLTTTPDMAANNYLVLPSEDPAQDAALKRTAVDAIVQGSQSKLRLFRSQELNNLAWSLARLVDERSAAVDALLGGVGREMCQHKRRVGSQDIGTTIWSFATLGFSDESIYRGVVSRFKPDMAQTCKPQELSNTLWAVATAEIDVGVERDAFDTTFLPGDMRPVPRDPITYCFGLAAEEMMHRPHQFKTQEIKDVLWSFSKMSYRHPQLFRRMAEHLVGEEADDFASARGLREFSPQGLGNMAWAYARQAQLADEVAERHKSKSSISLANGRLAVKTASYFDVGEVVLHRLFSEIANTDLIVHNGLADLKPQDISNTAWTFGVLGLRHDAFLTACKEQLLQRMQQYLRGQENSMTFFKGQEISNLLWALATLNVEAGDIMDCVGKYLSRISEGPNGAVTSATIANVFKRQELANIAWSCTIFGEYPGNVMPFLYRGLIGLGEEGDPALLSKTYQDGGLQNQAIMTLLYVQAAMDLSGSTHDLSLPPGFPDGWQQNTVSMATGDTVAPTFELSLSTSKIQRSVSSAFNRIGFEHVEEHTITMEDMATEYGINVASKPVEVLSIDIADPQDRIAIEVDGPAHFITRIDKEDGPVGFTKVNKGKLEYVFAWNGEHQVINGPTALKQRLLHSLGWKVVHLPFWEWYRLQGDGSAEEDYCASTLDK
jgi:hypothetical protein